MKTYLSTTILVLFLGNFSNVFFSQDIMETAEKNYRRSSLNFVLIEDEDLGESRDLVVKAFQSNPFPDQYNKHTIETSRFVFEGVELDIQDYKNAGWYNDTLRTMKDFLGALKNPLNPLRYITADSSEAVIEPTDKDLLQIKLKKYILENNIAKQLVATWFNRNPETGEMDWELVKERGMYSASEDDKDDASMTADPTSYLMDFGLIGQTFTIFNKMKFYPNEPVAAAIRDEAKLALAEQGLTGILYEKAAAKIDTLYERTKVGYTVIANTFLYKLVWNDSVANLTKSYFFNDAHGLDRKAIWDTTSLYQLEFLEKTTTSSLVTFKIGERRTEEELIDLQVRRTMDNVVTKLQKKNVSFRPVTPVAGSEGKLTVARIGKKEGMEPKQKWDVLIKDRNNKGFEDWKVVGKVTVDKKSPIWDNRQGAEDPVDENGNPIDFKKYSYFSGGKLQPDMTYYLRLQK